jgi:hypothetical protein
MQISLGKAQNCPCVDPDVSNTPRTRMEDFMVTCPFVQGVPHLISGSCASPWTCGLGFLQTLPHSDALALLLAFGSADTWRGDFHPARSMPYLAHTVDMTGSNRPASDCPLDGGVMSPFAEAYARCDDRAQAKAARQTHRWPGQSTEIEKSPRWRRRKEPVRACLSSRAPPPS